MMNDDSPGYASFSAMIRCATSDSIPSVVPELSVPPRSSTSPPAIMISTQTTMISPERRRAKRANRRGGRRWRRMRA